ncbi:disease resistance protein RUN1-like isoform X2 [Nymphaea colorata]|uniref:disease resistance protein RUN1-like isoform X2 n=1 Tax=Nymphaea colorata TaxID=210225 RepID=UPI00129EE956|nr:disease resistance protein RUN1-like isoform X2 [Nymphaea colorata]
MSLYSSNRKRTREDEAGPSSAASSSNGGGFDFDVFLSFRGKDTRGRFTSHLYKELNQRGISAFIDSEGLRKGEKISELFPYMEATQVFVPVLSKNYAESKWCLLEAAKMLELHKADEENRWIIPVFLDVAPSDIKDDSGSLQASITECQKKSKLDKEKAEKYRCVLRTLGQIAGYSLITDANGDEAKFCTMICDRISGILKRIPFGMQPIGIDYQINEVMNMLDGEPNGISVVGICGKGGIGKTTIAMTIFDKLSREFRYSSFISDVRETAKEHKDLRWLQAKLISDISNEKSVTIDMVDRGIGKIREKLGHRTVLIVLDDIDDAEQLDALIGDQVHMKREHLFGAGSKIIVTTRSRDVLIAHGFSIYCPKELEYQQSLKLFCLHAFKVKPPTSEFLDLSEKIVKVAGGLPLALKVFGSHFCSLNGVKKVWEVELGKLQKHSHKKVIKRLKISYDGLDFSEKYAFLDIACFLIGSTKQQALCMWEECYAADSAINVLESKSLISIDVDNKIRMHDQIQDMGRWIVKNAGNLNPYMYSRLWEREDVYKVLKVAKRNNSVEGIVLNTEEECGTDLVGTKAFKDMSNLRLLRLNFVSFQEFDITDFPEGLKWLEWKGCEMETLFFDHRFNNLVILNLSRSNIMQLQWGQKFYRLKVLDLSYCSYLERTPNFDCIPQLEKLLLDGCNALNDIDTSICLLRNLNILSMRDCASLEELPNHIGLQQKGQSSMSNMSKLEELNLQGCEQLQCLPRLPSSLKRLLLQGCKKLKIVHGFENLKSIELLNMDGCEGINYFFTCKLYQGNTFTHLEELSISGINTMSDGENYSFAVPLCLSSPLLLENLQCYGGSGNLCNGYIKVCLKDMEDNQAFYETILSIYRDIDKETDDVLCYTVSFPKCDDINLFIGLSAPCLICVSTIDNFPLERVHILLKSANKWSGKYSKVIHVDESSANSWRISTKQSQLLPSIPLQVSESTSENYTFGFDVLVSFTKVDIVPNFVDSLCKALQAHGILIFNGEDDESKGVKVEEMLKRINKLPICIPIFSKCFSQSKWCLSSVAKMVEYKKLILPVYFQVAPLDIGRQRGDFGTYFSKHDDEKREIVEGWRKALEVIVTQCNHQLIYETKRYTEEIISIIRDRISSMLNSIGSRVRTILMDPRANGVMTLLGKKTDGVCMVGIYGQSGIGKTTIAKAVYEQLSHKFDGSAFILDVGALARTGELMSPKGKARQFGRQKKVLIVFDNVDGLDAFESDQIFDRALFGEGSKIIIIAKDKKELTSCGLQEVNIYFACELNNTQSLRLLGYHAFKGKQPTAEIVELARKVTEFAGGLPLALVVLGSLLSSMRTKEEWESMLEKLSSAPGEGLDKVLKVSMDALHPHQQQVFFDIACLKECAPSLWKDIGHYPGNTIKFLEERCLISLDAQDGPRMHDPIRDWGRRWIAQEGYKCSTPAMNIFGLDLQQQNIFLDIACYLIGREEEYATYMWEDCGYSPTDAIKVLQDRCLIRIDEDGRFKMKDYIRNMGRSMVEKGELSPCMYGRIWNENLPESLRDWEGWSNDQIEGINALLSWHLRAVRIEAMGNVRVAHLIRCYFLQPQPLKNLRWLRMEMCVVDSWLLNDGGILENLVVLQLHYCRMWSRGEEDVVVASNKRQVVFKKLKVLEILGCQRVSLDFSLMPSILKLVIEESREFDETPKTIAGLSKLKYLRITDCQGLKKLSSSVSNLSSLETLQLGGCRKLQKLPECLGDLAALGELILSGCQSLEKIYNSIIKLNRLHTIDISGCRSLPYLPQLPSSLITLDASGCTNLRQVADMSSLKDLKTLNLDGCDVLQDLPGLHNLKSLTFLKLPFHISQREKL